MLACFGAFFLLMSFISRNAYDNGNFTPETEQERLDAAYERQYKYLETRKQPKYAEVDLELDLFPSERKASYSADIILVNEPGMDTLFLNWKDFVTINSLTLNGQDLKLVKKDEEQSISAYLIPQKLHIDSVLHLSLMAEKRYVGFTQSDVQADLTYVGIFASIQDFLPVIGYDSDKELMENRKRQEQRLNKLSSRMTSIDAPLGLSQSAFSTDAHRVKGSITISTEEGQFPFAAGELEKKEDEGDRPVAHYRIEQPQVFNWHVGSSDYTKLAGQVNGIEYAMLHKPSHTFNLDLYQDAMNKAIAYMQKHFGTNAVVDKLQLIEIHRWQNPKYTFANTIALSEKEGWVADTEGLQEQAYIYQTIGSGLASLWIQQNVGIANVQGGDMLAKALPEAIGLQFVKETFGEEAVQLLIKKKMDKYAKDRNNEPNTEQPLIYADGADYLEENKGAVVLYEAIDEIGLEKFSKSLIGWSDQYSTLKTFKDFLSYFKQEIKSETYSKFILNN